MTKSEMTYRSDFITVLRDTLQPHNLDVRDEIRITLIGSQQAVLIPDLLILERGKYEEEGDVLHIRTDGLKTIIETKHPKQYSTVGVTKLVEYCNALTHELGFVTNFKDLIEYRIDQHNRPSLLPQSMGHSASEDSFKKIALYILKAIQTPKPESREISDQDLVKLLQNSLEDIQSHIVGDVNQLGDTLGIFQISYDKDMFKPAEREQPQIQELVRKAASFVILNQIIFYIALSHRTRLVGDIGALKSLDELQGYFDHITEAIDYKAVFGAKVVKFLPATALETINSLITNLKTLQFYDVKREILGKIYHNLIPHKIRKRIAAYYTSNTACELLARLSIRKGGDSVLDPSCGSGGFLVAAYNMKKELQPRLAHKDIIKALWGFDISLFASHLSVINITLKDLKDVTNEVYVVVGDAFDEHPLKIVELLYGQPSEKRFATSDGIKSKTVKVPLFDSVLMNPPFTRIERLEERYKDRLLGKHGIFTKDATFVEGQSGLHCFFLIHVAKFLKNRGIVGAVLPAATFSSEYGLKLKPFIMKNYSIQYLVTYENLSTFSVDCDFKEVLFIALKGEGYAKQPWKTKVIVLKKELKPKDLEPIANQLKTIKNEVDTPLYSIRIVNKRDFAKERNWIYSPDRNLSRSSLMVYANKKQS